MYIVIKAFKDAEDGKKLYKVGDIYPTADKTKERIEFLKSAENKLGTPVIKWYKKKPK